jgi:hypothetical protein
MGRSRPGPLVPERWHRRVIEGRATRAAHDPCPCTVMNVRGEGLPPIQLLRHRLRARAGPLPRHHLDVAGEASPPARLADATRARPHGLRRRGRGWGPRRGGAISPQPPWAHHRVTPWALIHAIPRPLGQGRRRFPRCPVHLPGGSGAAMAPTGRRLSPRRGAGKRPQEGARSRRLHAALVSRKCWRGLTRLSSCSNQFLQYYRIVGQEECSIASRASNECEPQQLQGYHYPDCGNGIFCLADGQI